MTFTFFRCGDSYSIYLMKVYKTHSRPDSVEELVPRRQEVLAWSPADRIFLHTLCKSTHLVHLGWHTLGYNFFVQGFFLQMKGKVSGDSLWRQHHSSEWPFPSWHCVDTLKCFFSSCSALANLNFIFIQLLNHYYVFNCFSLFAFIFLLHLWLRQLDTKQHLLERKVAEGTKTIVIFQLLYLLCNKSYYA